MAIPTSRSEFKEYCTRSKYSVWYFALMEKAAIRGWTKKTAPCYVEGHHAVPRSISGDTLRTGDIVYLTPREHFVAHLLLPKMLTGINKRNMTLALHRLTTGNSKNYCKSSHLYSLIKEQHAVAASERSKAFWNGLTNQQRAQITANQHANRNPFKHTEETKIKHSLVMKGKMSKEKHPLWGKGHSPEAKLKCSINAARKALGKKWFNDGSKSYLVYPNNSQPHWTLGRV